MHILCCHSQIEYGIWQSQWMNMSHTMPWWVYWPFSKNIIEQRKRTMTNDWRVLFSERQCLWRQPSVFHVHQTFSEGPTTADDKKYILWHWVNLAHWKQMIALVYDSILVSLRQFVACVCLLCLFLVAAVVDWINICANLKLRPQWQIAASGIKNLSCDVSIAFA